MPNFITARLCGSFWTFMQESLGSTERLQACCPQARSLRDGSRLPPGRGRERARIRPEIKDADPFHKAISLPPCARRASVARAACDGKLVAIRNLDIAAAVERGSNWLRRGRKDIDDGRGPPFRRPRLDA